jgi:glutaconate CoA-transferase subunit B
MVDALGSMAMGGRVDLAVLSAAEVDRFGNLNALLIGDPAAPDVRFPGTGGNTDAACTVRRTLVVMSLEPRRFVEKVSFLTSPGYIDGPGARRAAGLGPQGPNMVVSTLGVFDFDTADGAGGSCEMRLLKLYPGVEQSTIEAMIPWPLVVANSVEVCSPPSPDELALLRNLDPRKQYLRGGRY